jgi:hypothetical protein
MRPPNFHLFADVASTPFFWFVQARDLLSAAHVLLEQHEVAKERYWGPMPGKSGRVKLTPDQQEASRFLGLPQIAQMLFGLALEVLLKGLLIARKPELVQGDQLTPALTGNHSLGALLDLAAITLTGEERELADRLSESIRWAGRYPVPKKEAQRQFIQRPNGAFMFPGTMLPDDPAAILALWNRICEMMSNDPAVPKYRQVEE